MKTIKLELPDGDVREYSVGVSLAEVLEDIGQDGFIAAFIDGEPLDITTLIDCSGRLELIGFDDPRGREIFWHSTSHIMAEAVRSLFPDVKLAIGPAIETGFYYDFEREEPFTPDDLEKIEKRMAEIISADFPFIRRELSREDALKLFSNEPYKVEILNEIADDIVSIYTQGNFTDLCRGPHISSTGIIGAFKLLSVAGAYWRGDERNKMLQRIYGISFPSKEQLDKHLALLEEAKKRDHRRLGVQLDLFSFDPDVGAGLVLWHPKGALVREIIEDFWRKAHRDAGYELVYTPHIGRGELWERSGHLDFYSEGMYSPMDIDGQPYYVKPMNCPFHIAIYRSRLRSYRELPVRWAELGTVYRYERSGVLNGLLRVRGFTQDDAHIICQPEQMESEIGRVLDFTLYVLKAFGFEDFDIYLSTRPEKYVGSVDMWDAAQSALAKAIEHQGLPYTIDDGEGTFYGPKIDVKIRDALGRSWQCSTIQFDFNEPERFDMSYIANDGTAKRPYMIHRALLGSIERFFAILIEHYGGRFPLWLSPVQVAVLPISEKQIDYASSVMKQLKDAGIRASLDVRADRISAKIRDAETEHIPYMFIVGRREAEKDSVSVRKHSVGDQGVVSLGQAILALTDEIKRRV